MRQMAIAIRNMRARRPTKPKTTPDRTLFCRNADAGAGLLELMVVGVCPAAVAVKVIVCPAVTTAGGEEVVEVDVEDEEVVEVL